MMQAAPIRDYKCRPIAPEVSEKLERSHRECLDLTERELRCPHCSRYILTLFSDTAGHFKVKCQNCKTITIYNMGYFRRSRKHKRKYR